MNDTMSDLYRSSKTPQPPTAFDKAMAKEEIMEVARKKPGIPSMKELIRSLETPFHEDENL